MQPKVELIEFGTKKVTRPLVKIMQAERAGFCAYTNEAFLGVKDSSVKVALGRRESPGNGVRACYTILRAR